MRMRSTLTFLVAALVVVIATVAKAQISTPGAAGVSQVATHMDACTSINAQAAAGSQTTLTIPAGAAGSFIYVAEIDFDNVVGTALGGAVAPTAVTTTNLGGLKWAITLPVTANSTYPRGPFIYPTGAKATSAATAVTIVGIAGTTNLTQTINACYWYGS